MFTFRSVKLDLLSSIFQNLYPTEQDCLLVCQFMSCPASLEEKYTMIRFLFARHALLIDTLFVSQNCNDKSYTCNLIAIS